MEFTVNIRLSGYMIINREGYDIPRAFREKVSEARYHEMHRRFVRPILPQLLDRSEAQIAKRSVASSADQLVGELRVLITRYRS